MAESIVFFEDSWRVQFGGGQRVTNFAINSLLKFGCYKNVILCDRAGSKYTDKYAEGDAKKEYYSFSALIHLVFVMIKHKPKKVVLCTKSRLLFAPVINLFKRTEVYYYSHTEHASNSIKNIVSRFLLRYAVDHVISVSRYALEGVPPQIPYDIIYNPISEWPKRSLSLTDCTSEKPVSYVYMGALTETKGVDFLLESFSGREESLHVFGVGELVDDVVRASKRWSNIKYHGFQENPWEMVPKGSIVVLPAQIAEACPMVLLESCGHGLRSITTSIGGQQELSRLLPNIRLIGLGRSEVMKLFQLAWPPFETKIENRTLFTLGGYEKSIAKILS